MKRLAIALFLLFPAPPALAQVNLSWNDTGPGSVMIEQFPCDTNEGIHTLVASFRAPAGVTKLTDIEAVIDFCTGQTDFPDWFRFGGCRQGALAASVDFTSGPEYFDDFWAGRGAADVAFSLRENNTGRIVVTASLLEGESGPLVAGLEYYAFKVTIDNRATVGGGSCSGCMIPACFVLNDLRLIGPGLDLRLNGPSRFYSPGWQSNILGCPFIVPVEAVTWSTAKARHR